MFIAEGENRQKTAKNVIQGGNLSQDFVCTNKSLLALLNADVSLAGKPFSFAVRHTLQLMWIQVSMLLITSKCH